LNNWSLKREIPHSNYLANLDNWNSNKIETPYSMAIFKKEIPRQTEAKPS